LLIVTTLLSCETGAYPMQFQKSTLPNDLEQYWFPKLK
jgi:hypothetical protein